MKHVYDNVLRLWQGMRKEWYWSVVYGGQDYGPFHTRREAREHAVRTLKKVGFTGNPDFNALERLSGVALNTLISAVNDWRQLAKKNPSLSTPEWVAVAEEVIAEAFGVRFAIDRINEASHYLMNDIHKQFKDRADALSIVASALPPIK